MSKTATLSAALCLAGAAVVATPLGARADVISDWNAKAEAIAVDKRMLPPPNARGMAIMHIAMFEAVNAIERRHAPYRLKLSAERTVSKEAAAAAAAHAVLVALHPDRQRASMPISRARSRTSPTATRRPRVSNSASGPRPRSWRYAPTMARARRKAIVPTRRGRLCPDRDPGQLDLRPRHAMGDDVRLAIPPGAAADAELGDLDRDVNEIKDYGGRDGSKRSAEQTDIGRFWFVTGPQAWNPIVRQLVAHKKLDIVDSARAVRAGGDRNRRCLHRRIRRQVSLQFLATGHGDPQCRPERQPGHAARSGLAAARRYADAS